MTTPIRSGQVIRAKRLNARVEPGTELLDEIDLSSTIEFTNIPQDQFAHLYLVLWGGIASPTANWPDVALRFNGDADPNYHWWRSARVSDNSFDEQFDDSVTGIRICRWGDVDTRNTCTLTVGHHHLSNWTSVHSQFVGVRTGGGTAGNHMVGQVFGYRFVSEPITSMNFFIIGGDGFSADSIASLYGMR